MVAAVNPIRYFSTNQGIFGTRDLEARIANGSVETVGLAEAILTGQAPDGGLFMPTNFPRIRPSTIRRMASMDYAGVFVEVMGGFFDGVLSESTLERIAQDAYSGHDGFEPFIEEISKKDYIGRLDEGPTAAFKDYAAQVLFRVVEALMKEEPRTEIEFRQKLHDIKLLTFITATSGDTGGAMGHAILNRERMWMAILHSAHIGEEVSDLQAKQMDTLGNNVYALWLQTDFDGCNRIAQDLQRDPELKYMNMNTANSSNIGRLLPQIAYYFYIYSRVAEQPGETVYFSVPSGNFGNTVAGLFAIKMGLPIKLIVGVNENDVFPRFYHSGEYKPADETISSPSNSMNINWPSNMRRLFQLYGGQLIESRDPNNREKKIVDPWSIMPNMDLMKNDIVGAYRISDVDTHDIIWNFYQEEHIIPGGSGNVISTLEPHGSVAWGATLQHRLETGYNGKIVTFETAHPGKFPESLIDKNIDIVMPPSLARLMGKPHGRYLNVPFNYKYIRGVITVLYQQELSRHR